MGLLKKVRVFVAIIILFLLILLVHSQLNDGLVVRHLQSKLPYYSEYDVATESDRESIAPLLERSFYYLGKGCQFYVFGSKDGKYVLKFPKQKHLRTSSFLLNLPLPSFIKERLYVTRERREERLKRLFTSCLLAYRELKNETGLAFIHLNNKSCFNKRVTLIDKIGFSHNILIDECIFVIQERGIDSREYFKELVQRNGAGELIRCRLEQLVDLIIARNLKKVINHDPAFAQNVGFSLDGSKGMLLDIGQLSLDVSDQGELSMAEDIKLRLFEMRSWAMGNASELVGYIDEFLALQMESFQPNRL